MYHITVFVYCAVKVATLKYILHKKKFICTYKLTRNSTHATFNSERPKINFSAGSQACDRPACDHVNTNRVVAVIRIFQQ